jgi:roadblock/LC7 domain-containing protein
MVFKNNNPSFYFGLILLATFGLFIGSFFVSTTGAFTSVGASITREGIVTGFFEVQQGEIAREFSASVSRNTKGWGIYHAEIINGQAVAKSYTPIYHTTYGDLTGFALGKGQYVTMVDGWPGADVTVYYKVE